VFRTSFQIAPNGGKIEKEEDDEYEDVDLGRNTRKSRKTNTRPN
jgi:hypothetical protein